jgi:peptidyl-prolyl cis-trans isomerase D
MSVIQTIRNKYLGLMIGLIVLALVGFLLMDAVQSNTSNLFSSDGDRSSLGSINGTKISTTEYNELEKSAVDRLKQNNPKASEADINNAKEEVWNQLVSEKLMTSEYEKLGLQVTNKEFQEMLTSEFADPFIQQNFKDPQTGQFNPSAVKQYVQDIKANKNKDEKTKAAFDQWMDLEKNLEKNRLSQKYSALISMGLYAPKKAIEKTVEQRDQVASINYVMVPYTNIEDKNIKVTDADILAYEKMYETSFTLQEEMRKCDYVNFDIIPTADDTAKSLGFLNSVSGEFIQSTNQEEFIGKNGDELFDKNYHKSGDFPSARIDSATKQAVGTVVGPYYEDGYFRMTKILDKKSIPDSVKASVIAIRITQALNEDAAKAKIDSIKKIANPANFAQLASQLSDDENTKAKGGDIGFVPTKNSAGNEVMEFLSTGTKGQIKDIKGNGAFQLFLITDQVGFKPNTKVATISKRLVASQATVNNVSTKVANFMSSVKDKASFDAAVKKAGLTKNVAENILANQKEISGLGSAREVVRYAFDSEIGKVSSILNLNSEKFVVAVLTDIYPKGLAPVGLVKQNLEQAIVRQKKAQMISDKFKSAGLDAIASQTQGTVKSADTVRLVGSFNSEISSEQKVIGASFNKANLNKVSSGIPGSQGVYFITVKNASTQASGANTPENIEQERKMQMMQGMQNLNLSLCNY